MKNITEIDKNFKIETIVDKNGIKRYNAMEKPFSIHGVFYESGCFRRLPESVAKSVSEGVYALHENTAGGRVRFVTDSDRILLFVKMNGVTRMSHFALTGSAGLDLYVREESGEEYYAGSYRPQYDLGEVYQGEIKLGDRRLRELTVNLPLYSGVSEIEIGLNEDAVLLPPSEYNIKKPIVFYGSSITQGGCASRPGNSYEAFISRHFHADYINLGFSGNAKGETEIAEYISSLDMSLFVYDYDYNAPTMEHLKNTHERMFNIIRKANPTLPVIMMTRPKIRLAEAELDRLAVVKATYEKALAEGDKNVYFIPGYELMTLAGNDGTVDGVHPSDLGFYSMAKRVIEEIGKLKIES